MPATTPKGFPYPVGTDRVMDGDDAIKNLATFTDQRVGLMQSGNFNITPTAANTTTSAAVTFPTAFPAGSVPNVVWSIHGTAWAPGVISAWTSSGITATGFVMNVQRNNTNAVPFQWIGIVNNL